jgi:hypothetical protein
MNPEQKSKEQEEKKKQINIDEKWEIDWWTQSLGISEVELIEAVKKAGPSVKKVKKYLSKKALKK